VVVFALAALVHLRPARAAASQRQQVGADRGNSSSNIAPAWPMATSANSLLVAVVSLYGTSSTTITAPAGLGWTLATRTDESVVSTAIYYVPGAASQSGSQSWAISGAFPAAVQLIEYTGVVTASPLDVTGSGTGIGKITTTTGSAATAQGAELAILGMTGYRHDTLTSDTTNYNQVGTTDQTPGTTGTMGDVLSQGTYEDLYTGATTPTANIDLNTSRDWAGAIVTFKVSTLYWIGCAGNSWTSTNCWSLSSGGAHGAVTPGTADAVVFDGAGGGNANNAPVFSAGAGTSVGAVDVKGSYSGTITYGVTGQTLTINNDLSVEVATFKVTAGTLAFATGATLHVSGGTFTAGGALTFSTTSDVTVSGGTLSGNGLALSPNNVTVTGGTYSTGSGTLTVGGDLTMSGGTMSTGGTVSVTGVGAFSGGTFTSATSGQTVTFTTTLDLNTTAAMKANPGNITVSGAMTMEGSATYTGASGSTSTFSSTLVMSGGTVTTGSGTFQTDGNVTVQGGTFTSSGTSTTTIGTAGSTNKLTITSGAVAVTGGTLEVTSSFNISGGTYTSATGATNTFDTTVNMTGGSVDLAGGAATAGGGISIATGTFTVDGGSLTANGTFNLSSGTFDVGGGTFASAHQVLISGGTYEGDGTSNLSRNNAIALEVQAGTFDLNGGTLNLSNATGSLLVDGGTFKATTGTVTDTSTLEVSAGTFDVNGGAVTVAKTVTIDGGTYQSTGGGTTAFQSTLTVSSGTFDGGAGSSTTTGLATVSGGTFNIGSSSTGQTLTAGMTISGGTLSGTSTTGVLKVATGQTLQMTSGTFETTTNSTSGPTIQSVTGTYTLSITGGTVSISGLSLANTSTAGLSISSTPTISKLDYINFANVPSVATTAFSQLTINVASLTLFTTGDKFTYNPSTYTATKNITLTDSTAPAGDVIVHFQSKDDTTNGQGRGDLHDADQDTSPDDGVGDTGNKAVAYWDYAVADDTTGTAEGLPTAAFDWTTFAFYSVYAAFTDTIYVRDTNGNAVSSYVMSAGDGTIVGTPLWNTEGGLHVVYVAMSGGKIYRLVDTSGTLALASAPWNTAFVDATNVASITTPLVGDGTNIYFAGANSGSTPYIYGVAVGTKVLAKQILSSAAITATPNVSTFSGSTYLFVGSSAAASQAYIYRVDVAAGMVNATCLDATASVNGSTRLSSNILYAGDSAGKLHGIDAFNFTSGQFKNKAPFPYQDTVASSAIDSSPFIDRNNGKIYFGDSKGTLHGVTTAGVQTAQLQVSTTSLSTPLTVVTGKTLVGDASGNVYYVNTSTSTYSVYYTVNLGTTTVTSISYDADSGQYMAATLSGHLVYLPAM
jgi:fibronectin-binding autotransporter adhesin